MRFPFAREVWPFLLGTWLVLGGSWWVCQSWRGISVVPFASMAAGLSLFLLFFFRDPERESPGEQKVLVSGADGVVRSVEYLEETRFLKMESVRISVFLNLFNVHVNRSPLAGRVLDVQYTPGKKLFAFLDAASEYNEHSSILIENSGTRCLVRQIVGPVARRVVCWLQPGQTIEKGQRIGIMKFGSRLDVYFPRRDVTVLLKKGDRVVAGKTVLAILNREATI